MGKQIPFSVLDEGLPSGIEKRNNLTFIMYKDVYDKREKENEEFIIYPETIRLMYSSKIAEFKKQIEGETSYYMKVLIKCNAPYILLPKVRGTHNGLLYTLILGFDIINDNDNIIQMALSVMQIILVVAVQQIKQMDQHSRQHCRLH